MKTVIVTFFCLCLGSITGLSKSVADGDNLFVFTKQSDAPAIYSLNDLDKITFSETGNNFWNTKWPTMYTYENFRLITFKITDNPNDIDLNVTADGKVRISFDRESETVLVESNKTLYGVTIYDVQGRLIIADNHTADTYKLSLLSVPRGIYIVRVKGYSVSQKIIK